MRVTHVGGVRALPWAYTSEVDETGKTEKDGHRLLRGWPLHERHQSLGGTRFTTYLTMAQY